MRTALPLLSTTLVCIIALHLVGHFINSFIPKRIPPNIVIQSWPLLFGCSRPHWSGLPRLLVLPLGRGTLPVPLGIDRGGEGVLVAQGDLVDDEDPGAQQDAGGLAVQQGGADEAGRRAIVHGGVGDVEGEAGDHVVHEDAKVVAEEGARDAERPRRRHHQDVAAGEQPVREPLDAVLVEGRVRRLLAQRALIQVVADEAQREDGGGQGVAGGLGAAAEELGKDLIVVFLACS